MEGHWKNVTVQQERKSTWAQTQKNGSLKAGRGEMCFVEVLLGNLTAFFFFKQSCKVKKNSEGQSAVFCALQTDEGLGSPLASLHLKNGCADLAQRLSSFQHST